MGTVIAHKLGGAEVVGDQLHLRIVAKQGMLSGNEAYEERIPLTNIQELLVCSGRRPEIAIRTPDRLIGLRVLYPTMRGLDGIEYAPVQRLANEIAAGNPAVRVDDVETFDGQNVTWIEPGKKIGYWKNLANSVSASAAAQQARKAGIPKVEVKKYKSEREFERDAKKMFASGWHIEGQSSRTKHYSLATGFFTNKGVTTVTWVKGAVPNGDVPPLAAQPQTIVAQPPTAEDISAQIRKLGELHDAGILTEAEFSAKKADLLSRM